MMEKLVDLKSEIKCLKKVNDERDEILKEIDKNWLDVCEPCTLVNDAVKRGDIPRGHTKSSHNPVCASCPIHKEIQRLGKKLDTNIHKQRILRSDIKKRYGKNRLVEEDYQ